MTKKRRKTVSRITVWGSFFELRYIEASRAFSRPIKKWKLVNQEGIILESEKRKGKKQINFRRIWSLKEGKILFLQKGVKGVFAEINSEQ